ncbi:MAG: maleylacetoacetate isomerase [Sphingomonadaceae bacterium]|nr:maleylacetoacetate isomerase [Sphingomonadaceae bacterium]
MTPVLYDYFRSSACYRVRIALNMKGIAYEVAPTNLVENAQHDAAFVQKNPQHFVPLLEIDGHSLTQSLAIIDYLDAKVEAPPLVPRDPAARARVLALALAIACDIHPLNNLRVLRYLDRELSVAVEARDAWYRHWVADGFAALEAQAGEGRFLGGDAPGLADICLVPQMFNARRLKVDLAPFPRLVTIDAAACALDSFARAHPDAVQPV